MDWMIVRALTGSVGVLVAIAAFWWVAWMVRTLRTILRNKDAVTATLRASLSDIEAKATALRVSLSDAEAKSAAILDAAVDGIITIDEHGTIQSFNRAAEQLFGYGSDQVIGRNVNVLMPEPYHSEHDGYLAAYKATNRPRIIGIGREVEGRRQDGSTFPMDLAVGESRLGGGRLFAGIVRDITQQKRIEDAEAKASAVLDAAVDGIITIDEHGLVKSFNRAAERIFGYTSDEVIGRNVNVLMPEPYHGEHDGYLAAYKATNQPRIIGIGREVEGRRKDGSTFPMELAVGESRLGGRHLFAGIVRDLTEKKRTDELLRRSEESFRLLVDNVRDYAITWLDTEGRIATWNAGAERTYGWSAAEAVGQPMHLFYPPKEAAEAEHTLRVVRENGRFDGEGWRIRKDGTRFWAHVVITPLWDEKGHMRGYVRVAQDISDRKRFEEELKRAKDDAERASVAKSKFLAAASHDLRQPVQALVFFASALATEVTTASAQPLLHDLSNSLDGLNVLLDSLLDVSRLDAGIVQPRLTNFSLATLLSRVQAEFSPVAADKRLTLKVLPTAAIVRSDPTLLERIIQNLLSNAIRYTVQGRVLVGCRTRRQTLRIEVWDQGIGIPDDRLGEIFQEFYQIGNPERDRSQGLGLGLAIIKRLSALLDHPVQVRSMLGQGSVFRVDVPLVGFNRSNNIGFLAQSDIIDTHEGKGLILVIDDEVTILRGLKVVLESWGYVVITATSEAEAMILLEEQPYGPDLIVADYRLRLGRTGIQAIRNIRVRYGNRSIPSILITGDTDPDRLQEAEASGYRLLHKPVAPPLLRSVLESYSTV
jgi:PAS domain S-box-containing protein